MNVQKDKLFSSIKHDFGKELAVKRKELPKFGLHRSLCLLQTLLQSVTMCHFVCVSLRIGIDSYWQVKYNIYYCYTLYFIQMNEKAKKSISVENACLKVKLIKRVLLDQSSISMHIYLTSV